MLTEKEIMIGDWVYSMFSEHPCKVKGIEWTESEYAFVNVSGVDGYKCIESLSPILITTDILEKNGFEKMGEGRFLLENLEDNYWVKFYPKDTNYTCGGYNYIDLDCGCISIREFPIEFVHQLQHVLRLCGIKKEIEL